jgi:multiple sugar transport system permease protein
MSLGRFRWAIWVGLGLFCAAAIAPFLYVLSASLKDSTALFQYPPDWIPSPVFLGNYETVLLDRPFWRWTLNTLLVALAVTGIKVVIDSMAGYAFAKMEFAGRKVLAGAMLATVMVPMAVLIVPLFFMVRTFGWLDTYWALIIPPLANPIGTFMMWAYIRGLPGDLENAARLDNCNPLQVYWHIILPLVKPGLVVVGIYTFLIQYTNFVWPLVVTSNEDMYVLTTGLASLHTQYLTDWGVISAASILVMVPITVVFILFQRPFVAASLTGAIKE